MPATAVARPPETAGPIERQCSEPKGDVVCARTVDAHVNATTAPNAQKSAALADVMARRSVAATTTPSPSDQTLVVLMLPDERIVKREQRKAHEKCRWVSEPNAA